MVLAAANVELAEFFFLLGGILGVIATVIACFERAWVLALLSGAVGAAAFGLYFS